jgi:hypothetical protein
MEAGDTKAKNQELHWWTMRSWTLVPSRRVFYWKIQLIFHPVTAYIDKKMYTVYRIRVFVSSINNKNYTFDRKDCEISRPIEGIFGKRIFLGFKILKEPFLKEPWFFIRKPYFEALSELSLLSTRRYGTYVGIRL